jgi:hypothetical protein
MKSLRSAKTLAVIAAMLPVAGHAITQCGPNICYTYDPLQAAASAFGTPTLLGDSMRFIPPSFRAESLNGVGTVTTSATWLFDNVYSVGGGEIGSVLITEAGDFSITGDSSGAADTVGVNLFTQVANNASAEVATDVKNFSASGNTASPPEPWALISTAINPSTAFAAVASNVAVSIQNTLSATTDELGGAAWIQKKFVVEIGTVAPVPVPAAVWLFGSAFGVLTLVRRRVV